MVVASASMETPLFVDHIVASWRYLDEQVIGDSRKVKGVILHRDPDWVLEVNQTVLVALGSYDYRDGLYQVTHLTPETAITVKHETRFRIGERYRARQDSSIWCTARVVGVFAGRPWLVDPELTVPEPETLE